jgi:DNA-binding NtrC family response regulator
MNKRILIIDDDESLLKSIEKILRIENYAVDTLLDPTIAATQLAVHEYHCLLLDVVMPEINGMEILKLVVQNYPQLRVIMISGHSNANIAAQAIKEGAFAFIEKPIDPDRLLLAVRKAID